MPHSAAKQKHVAVKPSVLATIRLVKPKPDIKMQAPSENMLTGTPLAYAIDAFQRSILFWDAIRKRGDNFLTYEAAGMPPVLNFKYDLLLNARTFDPPCNYALIKITAYDDARLEDCLIEDKPPVIVVDPRAGQSPGIGGFKRESEVGIALQQGHPVYFVIFQPRPVPHQTIPDVLFALHRFVEHVEKLHPGNPPIMYGNCQAGWMLALLAAERELSGPTILCGSPLSYWAGKEGKNAAQLAGGLTGGAWLNHILGDLGNGEFDGAWLIQNFETLHPANAMWSKYYDLYSKIDTEEERFLSFERWWNGFYRFSTEEIVATVSQLFIGDEMESGKMEICPGCHVNMKNISNPLLIFASEGDSITPPQEALAWIAVIYKTTAEMKAAGQRIVYMIDPKIGHLGIFVSADVARREHTAILGNADRLDGLKPGLYEMKILDTLRKGAEGADPVHEVRFEERDIEDIASRDSHKSFELVKQVSEKNDKLYSQWLSPWVQMASNPFTASMMRWLHPMRTTRYMWSRWLNPAMAGVAMLAPLVREHRLQATPDDFLSTNTNTLITNSIDGANKAVDEVSKKTFRQLYDRQQK